LFPLSTIEECVIPDAKSICSRRSSGSNRSNRFGNRDRHRYLHWVFEAKKRFGLCVLDYMVTSNHVHLLVKDTGSNVIAQSMQLIAGRTAQEYNQRKGKQGAFWEDRYQGELRC
jgi:REP element-mobilizing transposase RayT